MAVISIQAHQTSDGKIFSDKAEADRYEKTLPCAAEKMLLDLANEEFSDGCDVVRFMKANKSQIIVLLRSIRDNA